MKRILYSIIILVLIACSGNVAEDNTELFERNEENIPTTEINFDEEYTSDFWDYEYTPRAFGSGFYNSLFALDLRSVTYENNVTICNIHQTEMVKQNVSIRYGLFGPELWSYSRDIREVFFPNCNDFIEGGCIIGFERYMNIYVCENCNIDRDIWMEENWVSWKEKYSWGGTAFLVD